MLTPFVQYSDTANQMSGYLRKNFALLLQDTATAFNPYLRKSDTATMLTRYLRKTDTTSMLLPYLRKTDTISMLSPYYRTATATAALATKLNISDTAAMLSPFLQYSDTANLLSQVVRTFGGQTIAGDKTLTGSLVGTSAIFASISSNASNGVSGSFTNNSSGFQTLSVVNNGSGNILALANSIGTVTSVSNSGQISSTSLSLNSTSLGALTALIKNSITSSSGNTGYGLAIESEASAATSYALTVRNISASQTYFHVSTESGKVGWVGIGTASPISPFNVTSGKATFSDTVVSASIVRNGGTSSQILAANGSVITAGTNITISGGTISSTGGGGGGGADIGIVYMGSLKALNFLSIY